MGSTASEIDGVLGLIQRHQSSGRALLHRVFNCADLEATAEGAWVTAESGERYLDLGSFAVFLLGHRHPRVIRAVAQQLERMPCSSRTLPSGVQARAAQNLAGMAPEGLTKIMLLGSGTEAVEAAAKLARAATGRSALCHAEGSFHGKTFAALSLTDNPIFRRSCGPLLPEVARLSRTDASSAADMVRRVKPAALFVEAIQGEGGVYELGTEWLQRVHAACRETGALFVADEIQCGLGRTGELWAISRAGVKPDIALSGKALGGGVVPVSALMATPEAFRPFDIDPLLHTSTFGGNQLACAALTATLKVVQEERIPCRAAAQGEILRQILLSLVSQRPYLFAGVSGRGLMLGLHCARAEVAGLFMKAALKWKLLLTPCIAKPSVIRFSPPACLTEREFAFCGERLAAAAIETDTELTNT